MLCQYSAVRVLHPCCTHYTLVSCPGAHVSLHAQASRYRHRAAAAIAATSVQQLHHTTPCTQPSSSQPPCITALGLTPAAAQRTEQQLWHTRTQSLHCALRAGAAAAPTSTHSTFPPQLLTAYCCSSRQPAPQEPPITRPPPPLQAAAVPDGHLGVLFNTPSSSLLYCELAGASGALNMVARLSMEKKALSCSMPTAPSSSGAGRMVMSSVLVQSLGFSLSCSEARGSTAKGHE